MQDTKNLLKQVFYFYINRLTHYLQLILKMRIVIIID